MIRRRRRDGVSVGHDAFLDIVANLVGILIILVVVLGAQSQGVLNQTDGEEASVALEDDVVDPDLMPAGESSLRELAVAAAKAASAQQDSIRLERSIKELDLEIARTSERRTVLLALLQEARSAWESEQDKLDSDKVAAAEKAAEVDKLEQELLQLAGQRSRLENATPQVIAISHLPTPIAKTVFGEEVYLRLKNNRLSIVPLERLTEEIKRDFQRTSGGSRSGVSDAAVGPVQGFVARYVMNRRNELVSDGSAVARMTRAQVLMASFEPLEEPFGDPIEDVLANDDWLDVALAGYQPGITTVTIAVYPDSYASFRKLKERIYSKGYATAGRPIVDGRPIIVNFAGGGTRSLAQ
ncbi:MAG: hypothetical protein AAF802_29645 [Planctomycetota bacterium]